MARVLVVDDDPGIRTLVSYRLTRSGFEVDTAASGPAALRLVSSRPPELILLDILMPGPSGLEVLEQLRASGATARIPVIMLTWKAQESDIERGFALGAIDYMAKPFSPRELVSRVKAAMARPGP